ncbi:MAG TPA: heavy metal-binding domain-containing protein [Candidatus Dormibacteraeota bacterium]|nr:heavy metal-binding domain-containing protein [Candidatus Dormibacteraeota bacterium]
MARRPESGRQLFTSDLSVNEFVLVKHAGFEPVGLVMGSSVYHIGFQVGNWNRNMELEILTQAMYNARELAMARMQMEADVLGADGIVGVRLDLTHHEGAMSDFIAVGTAVRARDGSQGWRTPAGRPFTSDLSGQEFWTLRQAGYFPVSLVLGTCVYHIAHQSMRQLFRNTGQNVELPQFTQATYDARELAMSRMQAEAERDQTDGIVGVRVLELGHVWGGHAIEFLAIGTSVRQVEQRDQVLAQPMVLPLG